VIAGLIYFRSREVLEELCRVLVGSASAGLIDMVGLSVWLETNPTRVAALPLVPPSTRNGMAHRLSTGIETFGAVFDACALGQYLGGIDPRNSDASSTIGFVNETAEFSAADLEFRWHERDGLRLPSCRWRDEAGDSWTPIVNLHIHSKALHRYSSRLWITHEDLVTGERLQRLAGPAVYLATDDVARFSEDVWPGLPGSGHVLITHNSDEAVDRRYVVLLNDPRLRCWYAQNAEIQHPKLVPLPIGIANAEWAHGDLDVLYEAIASSQSRRKTELLHARFNLSTHPSRRRAWRELRRRFPALPERPTLEPFARYLEDLGRHRFAICPRGNGIDTHRFWEAQYLGVTPIVLRSVHSEYWHKRGLPAVIVDDWNDVTEALLNREYERIKDEPVESELLRLSYYRRLIARSLDADGKSDSQFSHV